MPNLSRESMLKRHSLIRLVAFLGVVGILGVVIVAVDNMLLSSLLAFVLSYQLGPMVNHMERRGVDRLHATIILFISIGIVLGIVSVFIFPMLGSQLSRLQAETPKYIAGLSRLMESLEVKSKFLQATPFNFDIAERIQERLLPFTESAFAHIPDLLKQFLTTMLLAPFLAFFMIKDGKNFSRTVLALVPNNIFEITYNIFHQINDQMGQFVRARLMEAAIVGLVTWVGLLLIGFPFSVVLAVFAAITNLIPYIGPIVGTVPAVIVAMINGATAVDMSLLLMVYFIAQLIDAAFIIPVVVAKIVDLHPVSVIVAIIIGAQLMGVVGMLISIPFASALKVTLGTIFRHLTDYRV